MVDLAWYRLVDGLEAFCCCYCSDAGGSPGAAVESHKNNYVDVDAVDKHSFSCRVLFFKCKFSRQKPDCEAWKWNEWIKMVFYIQNIQCW